MGFRINSFNLRTILDFRRSQPTSESSPVLLLQRAKNQKLAQNPDPLLQTSSNLGSFSKNLSSALSHSLTLSDIEDQKAQAAREQSNLGIGDRQLAVSNLEPKASLLIPESSFRRDVTERSDFYETEALTQEEVSKVRNAAAYIARDFVLKNPSEDGNLREDLPDTKDEQEAALKASIDDQLGDGVSKLLDVKIIDTGAGKSEVQFKQIEVNTDNLSSDQKEILKVAAGNASLSFSSVTNLRSVEGSDIEDALSEISSAIPVLAEPALNDLKEKLASASDVHASIEEFKTQISGLEFSPEDQARIDNALQKIESAASSTNEAFDENPLLDEFKIEFQSGRYALAHSSEEIETSFDLVKNRVFLHEEYDVSDDPTKIDT